MMTDLDLNADIKLRGKVNKSFNPMWQEFLSYFIYQYSAVHKTTWRPVFTYETYGQDRQDRSMRIVMECRPRRTTINFQPHKDGNKQTRLSVPQPWSWLAYDISYSLSFKSMHEEAGKQHLDYDASISTISGSHSTIRFGWSASPLQEFGQEAMIPDFPNVDPGSSRLCMSFKAEKVDFVLTVVSDNDGEVEDFYVNSPSGDTQADIAYSLMQPVFEFSSTGFNDSMGGPKQMSASTLKKLGADYAGPPKGAKDTGGFQSYDEKYYKDFCDRMESFSRVPVKSVVEKYSGKIAPTTGERSFWMLNGEPQSIQHRRLKKPPAPSQIVLFNIADIITKNDDE